MKRKTAAAAPPGIDPDRLALGIQQPWAELILRGWKTLEIRSLSTQVRGPIYLYASKRLSTLPAAGLAAAERGLDLETLPRGLLVGSVDVVGSRPTTAEDAAGIADAAIEAQAMAKEINL